MTLRFAPRRLEITVGVLVPSAALLVATLLVAPVAPSPAGATSAKASDSSRQAQARAQAAIAHAFRAVITLPPVAKGRASLEGYDWAIRSELQQAGTELAGDGGVSGRLPTVSETTGAATFVRPGEATVPLTIRVVNKTNPPPNFSRHFTAVVLETDGRWQVSWTTLCLLAESAQRQVCPPIPRHTDPGTVLPSSGTGALTSGLVSPGPLAIAPDGGVLVADQDRNQILEWRNGTFRVVAGNGLEGFSGDGGPAVDAELDRPGEIAVGPNGTVYFVDGGNARVRAVTPAGAIETVAGDGSLGQGNDMGGGRPATAAPLNPSGVAVSPSGVLYIASNSDIFELAPGGGGLRTLVAGGAPYGVDVDAGGMTTAFYPESLAVAGDGDLIVFSFSPKYLFSVSPSGQVTQLGQDYATALSEGPDGSVLVAEHGPGLERVNGSTVVALDVDTVVPGVPQGIAAEGIAQAANGVIYVDAQFGDGYSTQSGLYAIVDGTARPVALLPGNGAALPAVGAPGFPAATFPAPVAAPRALAGGAITACPSLQGVVPFTASATRAARQLLGFWNSGFSYNLHASDRSWWTGVLATFAGEGPEGRLTVGSASGASHSIYGDAIAAACGRTLMDDSIEVVLGPSAYDFSYQHVFLLDRDGTPLVYFAAV